LNRGNTGPGTGATVGVPQAVPSDQVVFRQFLLIGRKNDGGHVTNQM
jgi:hypothetical protein